LTDLKRRDGVRLATVIALVATAATFGIGIRYGSFAAADTDPFGYVSQAELIAGGTLRVNQQYALTMPWRDAELSFIPAGYKRATVEGFIVPTYPMGLPMVMAALLRLTGDRDAVFYAVPLLGALAVWATFLLGARLHSRPVGAAAAVLLVTSPSFLLQITQPVSDVPAAAWWTLSLVLALSRSSGAAIGAGAAASMAILTRPNLVPLAAVLGAFYLWRVVRAEQAERRAAARCLLFFCAAVVPGCLGVAATNNYLYGSPLASGYAPFHELYQWKHVPFNLDRYPRWLLQTQTPFIYLGVAAPFLAREKARAWLLLTVAGVVILSYIPYGYFGYDEWFYLRFLLPAYPALFVLGLIAGGELLRRVVKHDRTVAAISIACVVALASWLAWTSNRLGALGIRAVEQRYVEVGRYIAAAMPPDAVYIASLHSGSIRYYSGQPTINFSTLHPRALQDAITSLVAMGRRPYIVIEEGEEPRFKWQFDYYTELGKLDWPPGLQTLRGGTVRIYDPADREQFMAGKPIVTYDIGHVEKPIVTQK
jgi:hypothetical protein